MTAPEFVVPGVYRVADAFPHSRLGWLLDEEH